MGMASVHSCILLCERQGLVQLCVALVLVVLDENECAYGDR
jgi:hypothetical protein